MFYFSLKVGSFVAEFLHSFFLVPVLNLFSHALVRIALYWISAERYPSKSTLTLPLLSKLACARHVAGTSTCYNFPTSHRVAHEGLKSEFYVFSVETRLFSLLEL